MTPTEKPASPLPSLWQDDWASLRRAMQGFVRRVGRVRLEAGPGAGAPVPGAGGAWLEARAAEFERWEEAVRAAEFDLEGKLKAVESAWGGLEEDLDAILRGLAATGEVGLEEARLKGAPEDEARLLDLSAGLLRMRALWSRLLRHERKAAVEKAWLSKTWLWLRDVSLPALQTRVRDGALEPKVAALRARLARMDRYWARFEAASPALAHPGLQEQLSRSVAAELKRLKAGLRARAEEGREAERARWEAEHGDFRKEAGRLRRRLEEARAALAAAELERKRLAEEAERLEAARQTAAGRLDGERASFREEVAGLRRHVEALWAEAEALKKEREEAGGRLREERLEAELEAAKRRGLEDEAARLGRELEGSRRGLEAAEARAAAAEKERASLAEGLKAAAAEKERMRRELLELAGRWEAERARLLRESAAVEGRLSELERARAGSEEERLELLKRLRAEKAAAEGVRAVALRAAEEGRAERARLLEEASGLRRELLAARRLEAAAGKGRSAGEKGIRALAARLFAERKALLRLKASGLKDAEAWKVERLALVREKDELLKRPGGAAAGEERLRALSSEKERLSAELERLRKELEGALAGLREKTQALGLSAPGAEPRVPWEKILAWLGGELEKAAQEARLGRASGALRLLGAVQDTAKAAALLAGPVFPGAPAPLGPVLDGALRTWAAAFRSRRISVLRRGEALPECLLAKEAVQVALYQILRNAYEAMPRGGSLAVESFLDAVSAQACLRFSDQGTGFSKQALEALPVPCACPRPGHLGLGLALAARIMAGVGGELAAANGPSGGAAVTLRFRRFEALPRMGA